MALSPVSASTITVSGMNTASGGWYHTSGTFLNYCPECGHYGCLEFGIKLYNEITCTHCDADYSVSGKEKIAGGTYLIRAYKHKKKKVQPKIIKKPSPPTPLEIVKTHINDKILKI